MTIGWSRDGGEIDALVTDRYLEALLALHPQEAPPRGGDRLHPAIPVVVDRLIRDLPRFHPSFRFEERLAARLAQVAASMRRGDAPVDERLVVDLLADPDPLVLGMSRDIRVEAMRPLLIGGVVTSAAVSLAGAAFVVWRRSRPSADPMTRAVRAVARGRLA